MPARFNLLLAPGLGLVRDVIIDQHFAERRRIGRLAGAVAQNPRELGLGVDEDTAVILRHNRFEVIGSGGITRSNIAKTERERALSLHDVRMHVLAEGQGFDLVLRRPQGETTKGQAGPSPTETIALGSRRRAAASRCATASARLGPMCPRLLHRLRHRHSAGLGSHPGCRTAAGCDGFRRPGQKHSVNSLSSRW